MRLASGVSKEKRLVKMDEESNIYFNIYFKVAVLLLAKLAGLILEVLIARFIFFPLSCFLFLITLMATKIEQNLHSHNIDLKR